MIRRAVSLILFAMCALSGVLMLFLPLPHAVLGTEGLYLCAWENGTETREDYDALYPCLQGLDGEGNIALERDGVKGYVATGESVKRPLKTLAEGELVEALLLNTGSMSALERAAFYRAMQKVALFDGDYFGWTDGKFMPVESCSAEELIWFAGKLPVGALATVSVLRVRAEAPLGADTPLGSGLSEIYVEAPYSASGGAVYLDTPGGRRFVCALPSVTVLEVGEADFADEGALLACTNLREVSLPFVGSARSGIGSNFEGLFAHLFLFDGDYYVPSSLQKVRVRGGKLIAHAFYRCAELKEIDACGVEADNIDLNAFIDCTALKRLHTPRAGVALSGRFASYVAPCGCTVYERAE